MAHSGGADLFGVGLQRRANIGAEQMPRDAGNAFYVRQPLGGDALPTGDGPRAEPKLTSQLCDQPALRPNELHSLVRHDPFLPMVSA